MSLTVEIARVKEKTKYDSTYVHQHMQTSHAGAFATDLARSMTMCAFPLPAVKNKDGSWFQQHRVLEPKEIAMRATEITREVFAAIEAEGWTADVPTFAELLVKDSEQAGFFGGATRL